MNTKTLQKLLKLNAINTLVYFPYESARLITYYFRQHGYEQENYKKFFDHLKHYLFFLRKEENIWDNIKFNKIFEFKKNKQYVNFFFKVNPTNIYISLYTFKNGIKQKTLKITNKTTLKKFLDISFNLQKKEELIDKSLQNKKYIIDKIKKLSKNFDVSVNFKASTKEVFEVIIKHDFSDEELKKIILDVEGLSDVPAKYSFQFKEIKRFIKRLFKLFDLTEVKLLKFNPFKNFLTFHLLITDSLTDNQKNPLSSALTVLQLDNKNKEELLESLTNLVKNFAQISKNEYFSFIIKKLLEK